ncbi:hypothetical protein ACP7H9_02715 [Idiomarina sp. ST20R2A10]|uniref:hypothetical protein n=1 Tax=Idiomarina sp. ST20R2A10 TaxID=3418369 RepID=UPI003EC5BE14
MKSLEKLFDEYSLNARVKPAFLLMFPAIISVIALYEPSRSWGGAAITILTSFGVIAFAANQMSTRGNILQEKLFKKWGGAPTTIILRHSDFRLDKNTKARYMSKLVSLIPSFKMVSYKEEIDDPAGADETYRTAAIFLREHTRSSTDHPLVFKENIAYGFSRNTRAFKWLGVVICLLSIAIVSTIVWSNYFNEKDGPILELLLGIPFERAALILLLVGSLFSWLFLVTEKWVEVRAFAYARALYASCEHKI